MLHCRAIPHRLRQMSSNCSLYMYTLKNFPISPGLFITGPALLPTSPLINGFWFAEEWVCSTQITNNWFNWIFFLLENTSISQYGIPKIKSLSINPMGCAVHGVLQDFCYLAETQTLAASRLRLRGCGTSMRKAPPHGVVVWLAESQKDFSSSKMKGTEDHLFLHTTKMKNEGKSQV